MLEIKSFRVLSLSVEYLEIRWELEPTREDVLDFTFQIFRSEGSAGPWDPLSPEMEDRYIFIDNRIDVTNRWREYNYLLRVKQKGTDKTIDIGPVSREPDPDLIATELRKHFNLLMREFVGRRCWVLQKRTFGQDCSCFDRVLKQRKRSGCRLCFDTGFIRGYYAPIETFIQIDPSANTNTPTQLGKVQVDNTTARLGFFPSIKPEDIIIEPENVRWRVLQVNNTQRLRATIHQEIQIHQIPRSDIEFAIELDFGTGEVKTANGTITKPITLADLPFAGSRNFSNPQNMKAVEDDETPDAFMIYGNQSFKLKP